MKTQSKMNILQDSMGNFSSTRLGVLAILAVALFLTCWIVIEQQDVVGALALFSGMITGVITWKGISKNQENADKKLSKL